MSRALAPGLAEALHGELSGSFVQGVDAGDDALSLKLFGQGRVTHLLFSLVPEAAGAALSDRPRPGEDPSGALLSFRDHARGALTGLRLTEAWQAGAGRFLVLGFQGPSSAQRLVLDAGAPAGGARPNLAIVPESPAADAHALRRPHEREGAPADWLALPRDEAPPSLPPLPSVLADLLRRREAALARDRLERLLRELRAALQAARRLVGRREDDVARLGDAGAARAWADGLAAVLHEVRQGQSRMRVTRLDDGSVKELALDPRLGPGANLRKCYGLAAKAERSAGHARRLLEEARERRGLVEERLLRAEELRESHGTGPLLPSDVQDVAALARECEPLLPRRPPAARDASGRGATRTGLPEGVREWTSHDGLRILAGRSATSNDALTFRVARGNDAWLHARGVPGPHVVLVVPKGAEVPQESLLDAATVAHVLGKGGAEPRGDVAWTRVKHVRRIRGAAPGQVTVAQERVIHLRVEPERVARLGLRWPA